MYQVNYCQGGYCWDLVTMNSFKDGFGSYYSALVATKIEQVRIWIGVHLMISFLCKCI
jgi:hypothetical protein